MLRSPDDPSKAGQQRSCDCLNSSTWNFESREPDPFVAFILIKAFCCSDSGRTRRDCIYKMRRSTLGLPVSPCKLPAMSSQYEQTLVRTPSTDLCINTAVTSLAIWEFIITISDDVRIVWRRPVTVSSVLLGSVRWCMLLTAVLGLPPATPKDCPSVTLLDFALNIVGFAQTAVFSALRIFAVSNRNYLLSAIVLALSCVPVVTNTMLAAIQRHSYVVDPLTGRNCITMMSPSMQATFGILLYVTRSSLVIADSMVLVTTWIKTYSQWRRAQAVRLHLPITVCFLRDGTIYFVLLLASNVAHMLTHQAVVIASPMVPFITILPPLLISRFMINLKVLDSDGPDISLHVSDQQQMPPVPQRRATGRLGNIGGSLDDDWTRSLDDASDANEPGTTDQTQRHSLEA